MSDGRYMGVHDLPAPSEGSKPLPDPAIALAQAETVYHTGAEAMGTGDWTKAVACFLCVLAADALGRRKGHGGFYGG